MQLEEFDVYKESCTISVASNGCAENGLQDSSDDNCNIDVDDASFRAYSSESSINKHRQKLEDSQRYLVPFILTRKIHSVQK
jgi:hypothetical protein